MQKIKAFSILELIIVMIIIGIFISITTINFKNDELLRAVNQVAFHLRYTQYLALIDDKFNPDDKDWFKGRWQIYFIKTIDKKSVLHYAIFSDSGKYSGSPDGYEVAKNPLNPTKVLAISHAGISSINPTDELDLMSKFNISNVELLDGCSYYNSTRISFDNLGRPYKGNPKSSSNSTQNLITSTCKIRLTHKNGECIHINIAPITALISIADPQKNCN
ncbi:prepilin-type N-terminal cleavage/methylation domain-containing protein [Campylobacter porcelli]|uniref:Putative type II secretion system protein n=1 Tax=Campylobacter porcelli TaxID=1660073 RepID=A0A1X9SWP1_9BACT|nr:prepilin-type N-terminal cleavage/methylation domain-containing protein [Campylobacter sp. RM6137]ARR00539.1 putative type II secretion system protein [Campylobacter sp. RM6137]